VRARGLVSLELVTQALTTETAKVRCWPNPDGREEEDTCAQENKRREVSRDKSKEHTSNFRKEDKRMLLLRPTKKKDRMETMNQSVYTRAFFTSGTHPHPHMTQFNSPVLVQPQQ